MKKNNNLKLIEVDNYNKFMKITKNKRHIKLGCVGIEGVYYLIKGDQQVIKVKFLD